MSATHLARKAVELGLREVGEAPEMRQARELARRMPPERGPGPRVVFLTPRDWAIHVQWEATVAHALQLRGADVHFVTCGGGLEICDRVNTYEGPPVPCHRCAGYTRRALEAHGFPPSTIRSVWTADDPLPWPEVDGLSRPELREIQAEGLPLGRLLDVPLPWFLCNSDVENDPLAGVTTRRFLRSARRIAVALSRLLDELRPDVLVMLNGLFLFEGIAAALAESRGIRVVSYERGFIHGTVFFAHGASAQRYEIEPALWDEAKARPLERPEERRLDEYLADRRHGLRANVQLWPRPRFDTGDMRATADDRQVALFTNLTWDSAVLGRDSAYRSMQHWLVDVLTHLSNRPGVSVVVRVHPAEVRLPGWETREPAAAVIERAFPVLPANVRVIGPEDPVSSYPIMESADVGLVYTSTTGLELALTGTPVIVAGRAHYAGKGFTAEAESPAHHRDLVERALDDPEAYRPDTELARRYANLFFFQASLPQPPASEPIPGLARLDTTDPDDLRPGRHSGLDVICDGILAGAPFWLPRHERNHP